MENEQTLSVATTVAAIYDGVLWFFQNLLFAFYNIGYAALNPASGWTGAKKVNYEVCLLRWVCRVFFRRIVDCIIFIFCRCFKTVLYVGTNSST